MISAQNLPEKKIKIVEQITRVGPSLPSPISNSIGLQLLFTSALLGEMVHEGRLKASHLKIGGSPLYYIEGQEAQLDNFTKHLEKREQEALSLLKKEQVLEDSKLEPSHRVALRNIKDFAVMLKITTETGDKTLWKIHTLSKEETEAKINELLKLEKDKQKEQLKLDKEKEKGERDKAREQARLEKEGSKAEREKLNQERIIAKQAQTQIHTQEQKEIKEIVVKVRKPRAKKQDNSEKIMNYLQTNNLSIIKEIKQEDTFAIVSSATNLGNLNFLTIVKNKKKLTEADITLALHEGQRHKLPILFLTPGELSKKALQYVEENKGYIIIKNIKL